MNTWEIVVSLLAALLLGVMLYRLFFEKRVPNRFYESPGKKEILYVFLGALAFRLLVYLISILILMIEMEEGEAFYLSDFLNHWKQWDASNYLAIAENGYGGSLVDGKPLFLVFFPLYSYCIRLFSLVTGSFPAAALVVSVLSFGGGCCYLYPLVCADYGRKTARTVLILLSVFPFGFFFGAMMSESLFFFLTAAAFYYIRKHRWPAAVFFGALSCMTRMHGILLLIPAAAEMITCYRPFSMLRKKQYGLFFKLLYTKVLWLPFMAVGTLYYLLVNYWVTGNPMQFTIYQKEHWFQAPCYFTKTLEYVFQNAISYDEPLLQAVIWIPEAFLFLLAVALLVYGQKKHRSMYLFYLSAYVLLNYSVTWLLSGARYMSCAIPMFIILADWAERRKGIKVWLIAGSSILFGIYLSAYLFGKHIM